MLKNAHLDLHTLNPKPYIHPLVVTILGALILSRKYQANWVLRAHGKLSVLGALG